MDALGLVETLAANRGPDPFPLEVLRRLQDMTGADSAAAYVESGLDMRGRAHTYQLATRPTPLRATAPTTSVQTGCGR
jgi:hypothetical protein